MHHEHHVFQFDCDAVLFEVDGVLVDSRHCVERHWLEWAKRQRINPDKVLHYVHGRSIVDTIQMVAPQLDAQREAAAFEAGEAGDNLGLVKVAGALELLQSVPAAAVGIVTAGTRAIALTRLAFGGLPVPEVLITCEDVVEGKPKPEPYLFAAMMLGVKPERCVVVEAAPAGIQAGRAAGMHVVGVVSSAYPAEELSQAQICVRKLSDIEVIPAPRVGLARLIARVKGI